MHTEYPVIGGLRSPKCPSCKKLVKIGTDKGGVPEEYIVKIESEASKRKKQRQDKIKQRGEQLMEERKRIYRYEDEEEEEPEEEEEEGRREVNNLFVRGKTPIEILKEVLNEYSLNPVFIKRMVKRSERYGTIPPNDLRHYLLTMRSGIGSKNNQEADFIADDYYYALNKEREEAIRRGNVEDAKHYPPLAPPSVEAAERTYDMGREYEGRAYGDRFYPQQYETRYGYRPTEKGRDEKPLSRDDITIMMRDVLENKRKDDEISALKQSLAEFQEKVADAIQQVAESKGPSEIDILREEMKEQRKETQEMFKDLIANLGKKDDGAITADAIEAMIRKKDLETVQKESEYKERLLNQKHDDELRALGDKFDRMEEKLKEKGANDAMLESLRKEFNDILDKQYEEFKQMVPSGEYKDDSIRLLSEGIGKISGAIEKRNPLGEIKDLIITLAGGERRREIPKELTEEVSGVAGNVAKILKQIGGNEYVEEEERGQ